MSKQAFDAKRGTIFHFDPADLTIIEDTDDPMYDQRAAAKVNERLVKNIMYERQGVLQPVVVRKVGDEAQVVDGRQRVKAAVEANRRLVEMGEDPLTIPAVVRRGNDKAMFGVMISANEHRMEDDMLVKADKLARFLNQGGTEQEAAVQFGVSRVAIANWLKLLELDGEVRNHVKAGRISASAAAELSGLDRGEQREKAKALIDAGATTISAARKAKKGTTPSNGVKRLKSRKQIETALDSYVLGEDIQNTLRWVLNEVDDLPAGDVD